MPALELSDLNLNMPKNSLIYYHIYFISNTTVLKSSDILEPTVLNYYNTINNSLLHCVNFMT